jgi:hypothetical protein
MDLERGRLVACSIEGARADAQGKTSTGGTLLLDRIYICDCYPTAEMDTTERQSVNC